MLELIGWLVAGLGIGDWIIIIIGGIIMLTCPEIAKAIGLVLIIVGTILSFTVIGAIIGIPSIFMGGAMLFSGGK